MTSFKIVAATLVSVLLMASRASAAQSQTTKSNILGMDISWPQCTVTVPNAQRFGVVGVNDGLATTTNPCLSSQLVWASKSLGGTNQPTSQLYVNTANPGGLNTSSWPTNNTDPAGNTVKDPYGVCDHSDSVACAWQYGWNRAVEDATQRLAPAASHVGLPSAPAAYTWWLDVETGNTWKTGGTSFDYQSNTADIEGMAAYLQSQSVNVKVGLYSTAAQWQQIVGTAVASNSNLNGLINWRPGGASQSTAQQACLATPLTAGGQVVMTQFVARSLDYDYSCI